MPFFLIHVHFDSFTQNLSLMQSFNCLVSIACVFNMKAWKALIHHLTNYDVNLKTISALKLVGKKTPVVLK